MTRTLKIVPAIELVPTHLGWTVARYLRERHPDLRLRAGVRNNPLLESVTIAEFLATPDRIAAFLTECRTLPQCGETQIARLREVFERLAARHGRDITRLGALADAPDLNIVPSGMPIEGDFFPDFVTAWKSVYQRFWRLAHFDRFIYLPSSIPEFAKTPAVLRAELGPTSTLMIT